MNNYSKFKNQHLPDYSYIEHRGNAPIYDQANQYLRYCSVTRQMSPMTIRSKQSALRNLIVESKCKDLQELTNADYDRFVQCELERNVCCRTINTKTAHIVAFIKYWKELDMKIPIRIPLIVKLKEQPPRRACYTRQEIEEVLDNCNSDIQWLLIKIAFDTGMRINELRNLSLSQIHGRRINFIGKGTKEREVYLTVAANERLLEYIEKHPEIKDRIWMNEWGYPMSVDTIRRIMREAFVRCGHDDFYPHALRHSFGSDIQKQGADIFVIKEMMGHSNIATTQKYLHSLDGQLANLFDMYKC